MRPYENEPRRDYFIQGFRLGLLFGVVGALIILGRDSSPQKTLESSETASETDENVAAEGFAIAGTGPQAAPVVQS